MISGQKLKEKVGKYLGYWRNLGKQQKVSAGILVFLLLALPLGVSLARGPVKLFSRGYMPVTPPITPPNTPPQYPPTPTPTPTPISDPEVYLPVITTDYLASGIVGKKYTAWIDAYDRDATDVSLRVYGLPSGLSVGGCLYGRSVIERTFSALVGKNVIVSCKVSGTPRISGSFKIAVQVTSLGNPYNKTEVNYKTLDFIVSPQRAKRIKDFIERIRRK